MGRKKHLQGISDEEMTMINTKMEKSTHVEGVEDYKNYLKSLSFKLNIKCKTEKQKQFLENLKNIKKKINICNAPAGVGKSYLALYAALYCLKNGYVETITVIVPTVEASEACKIGLLPGAIDDKIEPYKIATISTLEKILKESGNVDYKSHVQHLLSTNLIHFELLSYARGRNYDNTFLIIGQLPHHE